MQSTRQDSATELANRFHSFLALLKIVIEKYPPFLKYKAAEGASWYDLFGALPRTWQKMRRGSEIVHHQENRYNALKDLLVILDHAGDRLYAKLYDNDDHIAHKVSHLASLSDDHETIEAVINYFAASASISMIQDDVKPLLVSIGKRFRLAPSEEFKTAFKALMEHAGNRSSKIVLMLTAVDHEAQEHLSDEVRASFKLICERFQSVAKLSDLMAAFRIFASSQPEKTAEQLALEQQAEQWERESKEEMLAMERRAQRIADGLPPDLSEDEELMESFVELITENSSKEVKALRDYTNNFDLDLLFPLLIAFRNWESGVKSSTKSLHAVISRFISYKDASVLLGNGAVDTNIKFIDEELDKLGALIHAWMRNGVTDEVMEQSILEIKMTARARVTVPVVEDVKSQQAHDELVRCCYDLLVDEQDEQVVKQEQEKVEQIVLPEVTSADEKRQLVSTLSGLGVTADFNRVGMRPLPPPPPARQPTSPEKLASDDQQCPGPRK